jgi:hypothetical protein
MAASAAMEGRGCAAKDCAAACSGSGQRCDGSLHWSRTAVGSGVESCAVMSGRRRVLDAVRPSRHNCYALWNWGGRDTSARSVSAKKNV